MPKLTTTPEIGAFLASQTKTEARSKIGVQTFLPTLLIKSDASTEAYMYDEIPGDEFSADDYPGLRIGDSVTSIGSYAFAYWSTNNAPLVIPDNVTSIGAVAFRDWSSNNHPLVIGDSVTSIGTGAFFNWGSNNHPIVIPDSVTQ
jgi:hypothetical protein